MKNLSGAAWAAAIALTATGCATAPVAIPLSSPYDPAAQAVRSGSNTISGNAVLRTVGGDVKTCAGFPVKIVPVTPYGTERLSAVYGNGSSGYAPSYAMKTFTPANPHWETEAGRTETCDSQGNFTFSNIADGDYYVVTVVMWGVPQSAYYTAQQGGGLFQRVSVQGGETKRVVLTQN